MFLSEVSIVQKWIEKYYFLSIIYIDILYIKKGPQNDF